MLRQLTHDILEQYGPFNLGRLTLVFPTRRAGLMLTELLRAELERRDIRRPILAPQITTLSELFESLSTLGREDEIRLVSTLYTIYRELAEDCPFELFFPWGRRLVNDFSNIDKGYPDIDPLPFLSHTASAHELEALKLEDDVRERLQDLIADSVLSNAPDDSVRSAYERIWQLLPELYTRFRQALPQRTYEGARMKEVLLNWDAPRVQQCLQGRFFIFAGFNYIVPAERELMLRLKSAGQAAFYWDYPSAFACNPKAFKWVRQYAEKVIAANAVSVTPWQAREVELVASDSVNAQARYVRQWLMEHHHAGDRTAIVLCDETLLQDVIAALPGDDGTGRFGRINISKGFPLSHTPVYAQMVAFLSDPRNEKQPHETYAAVIDRLIASLPLPAVPAAPASDGQSDTPDTPDTPETWTTLLAREAYYQLLLALNRFRLLLEEPGCLPLRSLAALRHFIKRYVQSISLPFHGEPLADIQVVGVLETRAMDFDNLLLLDVEEGVVPQVKEEESFIPFFLRKVYGLPTMEEATDVYAYNFFRLLRRPRQVTVCYCGSESKNNRRSPSRFLMQMMASHDFVLQKRVLVAPADPTTHDEQVTPSPQPGQAVTDGGSAASQPVLSVPDIEIGEGGFLCRKDGRRLFLSPTAISAYLTCPRKFYYAQVCGITSDQTDEGGVFTRAEMGSFVHATIQTCYERLNGGPVSLSKPLTLTPELLGTVDDALLSEQLDSAYEWMNAEYERRYGKAVHYIRSEHEMENTVILVAVRRILDTDAGLLSASLPIGGEGFSVLSQEQYATFPLTLPDGLGKVLVGGRIDRVDTLSGRIRIVDYKTASPDDRKLTVPPLDALFQPFTAPGYWLQTLIYAYAYRHQALRPQVASGIAAGAEPPVLPVVYFPRDTEQVCYPVHTSDGGLVSLSEFRKPFFDALAGQVKRMLTDRVYEQVEEKKCDSFCPFFALCGRRKND